jgi:branched-chain amino acid transport system substrate-binding protein
MKWRSRRLSAAVICAVGALALSLGACGDDGGEAEGSSSSEPLKIGVSLPLTGSDSQLGTAVEMGYKAWQKSVNDAGGILGREVELTILDDASNQNTVISDYNKLINDGVDFVLGTFSTRLTLPALNIAERHQKLFVDPAGGAPNVFERKSPWYFYTEPAPSDRFGSAFAEYIAELPEDERPKSVAYVHVEDPFYDSTIMGIRETFEDAGIENVADITVSFGEKSFDPVGNQLKQAKPDVVVTAGGFDEEVGVVRAMAKADFKPQILYQTNAPGLIDDYKAAVGEENVDGVFHPAGYSPEIDTAGNPEFVAAFRELFDSDPSTMNAFAYGAGQVLQTAVEEVGEEGIENQELLADYLREAEVETVFGPITWDEGGVPLGVFAIAQFQGGNLEIVLPDNLATSDRIDLCYRDC